MIQKQQPEIQGYCPVAYHAAGKAIAGRPEFAVRHAGRVYYCVNEDAQREFSAHPERYLPAYGGRCAFGMSIEKEFEPDPTRFRIINGRTHLFLRNADTDALDLWDRNDETKHLASADRFWAQLRDRQNAEAH